MNDFASRLEALRQGTSRRAFAQKIGITESTLRNYEKGVSQPDAQILVTLCQKLNILPEWLLLGSGPMLATDIQPHETEQHVKTDVNTYSNECSKCTKLEERLELVEEERRELSIENRKLHKENAELLREIGDLRVQLACLGHGQHETPQREDTSAPGVVFMDGSNQSDISEAHSRSQRVVTR